MPIFNEPALMVLIPIMVVMVLVGILRHHATQLLQSALMRARFFRGDGTTEIPAHAFNARRNYLSTAFEKNTYLKNPDGGDPSSMETMMNAMKQNMAMLIPQTVIMSWITFFFSGFVLIRLPFPLTLRFKAMLQRGIETADMDVTWVSSLSWYFLNLFGLKSIYTIILGEENAADGMRDMQAMQQMQTADATAIFKSEKEFLDLATYDFRLKGIEEKVLESYGVIKKASTADKKTN
ncbi:integral membrane protein DUF106-domain-containing protein [Chytridium lagenaria]|nr:integral membrane protein DUF106-domain-containing protein [Chytridium lagenaria]